MRTLTLLALASLSTLPAANLPPITQQTVGIARSLPLPRMAVPGSRQPHLSALHLAALAGDPEEVSQQLSSYPQARTPMTARPDTATSRPCTWRRIHPAAERCRRSLRRAPTSRPATRRSAPRRSSPRPRTSTSSARRPEAPGPQHRPGKARAESPENPERSTRRARPRARRGKASCW